MHACRIAIATAVLGMVVVSPTADSSSLQVGIRIVETCEARTSAATQRTAEPMALNCSDDTPHSVAWRQPAPRASHVRATVVPDRDRARISKGNGAKIATVTF